MAPLKQKTTVRIFIKRISVQKYIFNLSKDKEED